jgi:hypothetical protein
LALVALAGAACGSASAGKQPDAAQLAALCAFRSSHAVVTAVTPDSGIENAWTNYAATGSGWVTGDSIYSYHVPGLGTLNTLSDSFIHTMAVSTRPRIVHNLFVVQNRHGFTTITGGTRAQPEPLVVAKRGLFYLGFGGVVTGHTFQQFYEQERWWGPASLDYALVKTVIATFALPSLRLESLKEISRSHPRIRWGSSVEPVGPWTYIYGTRRGHLGVGPAFVARVAGTSLGTHWSYWDGHGWSTQSTASRPIVGAVDTQYDVVQYDGMYVLVTSVPYPPFSPDARIYFGCSPTGPFRGGQRFTLSLDVGPIGAPHWGSHFGSASVYVYDALAQPALDIGRNLVVSYDRNDILFAGIFQNPAIYRPGYLDLTIRYGPR